MKRDWIATARTLSEALPYLQRYSGGAWRNVRTLPLSAKSAYSWTETMTSTTDYSWRVLFPGDADHVAAASATRKVTVR